MSINVYIFISFWLFWFFCLLFFLVVFFLCRWLLGYFFSFRLGCSWNFQEIFNILNFLGFLVIFIHFLVINEIILDSMLLIFDWFNDYFIFISHKIKQIINFILFAFESNSIINFSFFNNLWVGWPDIFQKTRWDLLKSFKLSHILAKFNWFRTLLD